MQYHFDCPKGGTTMTLEDDKPQTIRPARSMLGAVITSALLAAGVPTGVMYGPSTRTTRKGVKTCQCGRKLWAAVESARDHWIEVLQARVTDLEKAVAQKDRVIARLMGNL